MKIVKKNSTENFHFYSRDISLYIAWECLRNETKTLYSWHWTETLHLCGQSGVNKTIIVSNLGRRKTTGISTEIAKLIAII